MIIFTSTETFARKYGERKNSVIFPVFLKSEVIAGLLSEFSRKTGRIQAFLMRQIFRAKISNY